MSARAALLQGMRLLLLTVLALLAITAPANAATGSFEVGRVLGTSEPEETIPVLAGPVPVGAGVVLASGSEQRGFVVRMQAPGAPLSARDLVAFPGQPGSSIALSASGARLTVVRHAEICTDCRYGGAETTLDAVLTGPLGGPLTTLAQCGPGSCVQYCSQGGRYEVSLDGDLMGVRDRCRSTASVIDLQTGEGVDLGRATRVAVAGRFVAVSEPRTGALNPSTTIVVRDASSGAEVYRSGIPAESLTPTSIALLADGTVIYSAAVGSGPAAVVTASPAAPAGRVVRELARGTDIVDAGPGPCCSGPRSCSAPARTCPRRAIFSSCAWTRAPREACTSTRSSVTSASTVSRSPGRSAAASRRS